MAADNTNNYKIDKTAALIAGGSLLPIEVAVMALTHGGGVSLAVGAAIAAGLYAGVDEYNKAHPRQQAEEEQEGSDDDSLPSSSHSTRPAEEMGFLQKVGYKLTHGKAVRDQATGNQEPDATATDQETGGDPRFKRPAARDTGGVQRLTIKEIVAHTEPNSYTIWIGRSLTQNGNPAILIKFYKQHFRFIGASQRGKSSMVAAFLEIVTRTHDPKHVQLILLDKENLTSNLFADLPHVLHMRTPSGERIKMHARNEQQVLQYLVHSVVIMKRRYEIAQRDGIAALKRMPVILVYIEEFLRLKAYFKAQLKTAKDKEQAESDYATFMFCVNELAGLGLKSRMQLLMAAQVDYADEDFREAMANISCGFSFCVKRDAAMAAGFTNAELLTRNLKENKVGQAVVECPDCNDLVLAPEYDLEARIEAWQEENEGLDLDNEIETEHLVADLPTAAARDTGAADEQTQRIKLALVEKNQREDEELERAINAYLEGATTLDGLGAAMGYKTQSPARAMMARVKAEIKKREAAVND
jgi:hypothetical protein